jgi:hypothetical protein
MTGSDPTRSAASGQEPTRSREQGPDTSRPAEDPAYLLRTGRAAAEYGSVVPVIGGLPAVQGPARDIGVPLEDRGADLADKQGTPPDQASHEDIRSS